MAFLPSKHVLSLSLKLLTLFLVFLEAKQDNRNGIFHEVSNGGRLSSNVISSYNVGSLIDCGQHCNLKLSCSAFNYRVPSELTEINCQLTSTTKPSFENDNDEWTFYEIPRPLRKVCLTVQCSNNGMCVESKNDPDGFLCKCPFAYEGKFCDIEKVFRSCKAVLELSSDEKNGVYNIQTDTTQGYTKVYCHMTPLNGCPSNGWTMVMKIDGAKRTFVYSSPLWTNTDPYNIQGGLTGFDEQETKLPTFNSTDFTQICVGMKLGDVTNYVVIDQTEVSLYKLFVGGHYHATNIGRAKWRSLLAGSSFQDNCNKEGFNVESPPGTVSVRLGIITNNENDCISPDSFLGVGGAAYTHTGCGIPPSFNACGNIVGDGVCAPDNGLVNITAMGYILVR